jgi:hypothetical protein
MYSRDGEYVFGNCRVNQEASFNEMSVQFVLIFVPDVGGNCPL